MVKFKLRKSKKKYSYRKRHLGYDQSQRNQMSNIKIFMVQITALKVAKVLKSDDMDRILEAMYRFLYYKYLQLIIEPSYLLMPIVYLNRTIESFHEEQAYHLFRFQKTDLRRLMKALRIPDIVCTKGRNKFTGEEVFLFSLMRLCSLTTLDELAKTYFGRDYTAWSRAFKWFLVHLYTNFHDLMCDNLDYWQPYFKECAAAIQNKLAAFGLHYDPEAFGVCGFIDDHCFAPCRPCGPKETVEQWMAAQMVQQAFYNGWKSKHGLKWQTFDLPNGMTADMFGPRSLRRNDLRLLVWSKLDPRMHDCQLLSQILYLIYGDSIFPQLQHIRSSHKGNNLTDRQILENRVLKKVRICIEWHYGHLASLFPFIDYKRNVKLLQQPCELIYFAASLLRNCHCTLYGNQTSSYFKCTPPSLESFMQVE